MNPVLLSALFGFLKGFTSSTPSQGWSLENHFWSPVKEELLFRGAPLWAFPHLPVGTTAVAFAGEHLASDWKKDPTMTPLQVVARLGDVFLGGWLYERAFRRSGILAAIGAHLAHNNAISLGQRLRNGSAPEAAP